jgi:hypothetical protein
MLPVVVLLAANRLRPLIDLTFDGPNGTRFRPAEARGKIRVIGLFTADCVHCTKTAKLFNQLQAQYKPKGVQFFGALTNAYAAKDLTSFISKINPAYPMGMLTKENTLRLADFQEKDRPFAPILLFVNKSNMVEYQLFGNEGADSDFVIAGLLDKMLAAK